MSRRSSGLPRGTSTGPRGTGRASLGAGAPCPGASASGVRATGSGRLVPPRPSAAAPCGSSGVPCPAAATSRSSGVGLPRTSLPPPQRSVQRPTTQYPPAAGAPCPGAAPSGIPATAMLSAREAAVQKFKAGYGSLYKPIQGQTAPKPASASGLRPTGSGRLAGRTSLAPPQGGVKRLSTAVPCDAGGPCPAATSSGRVSLPPPQRSVQRLSTALPCDAGGPCPAATSSGRVSLPPPKRSVQRLSTGLPCDAGGPCPAGTTSGISRVKPSGSGRIVRPSVPASTQVAQKPSASRLRAPAAPCPGAAAPGIPGVRTTTSGRLVPPPGTVYGTGKPPARPAAAPRAIPGLSRLKPGPPMKVTTKSVEVRQTPSGPEKVTKEVVLLKPAPPGIPQGAYHVPSMVPGERVSMVVQPSLDPTSPYLGGPMTQVPPKSPLGEKPKSALTRQIEKELLKAAKKVPHKTITASGTADDIVPPPIALINDVPVQPVSQVITERSVEKSPGTQKTSRTLIGISQMSPCTARRIELQMQMLEQSPPPHASSPPKETISVKSVMSISAEGQRGMNVITTYEKTEPAVSYGLTTEEVDRMVAEENQDVNKSMKWKPIDLLATTHTSHPTKTKEHKYRLSKESMKELETSVKLPEPIPDEAPQDELQPELMATIMHTEEKGMDMMSEPTTIYTYLFPEASEIGTDVIEVNSAAPAPLHDIAVPSHTLPEAFYNASVNAELERVILETEGQKPRPSAAGFTDFQEKSQSPDAATVDKVMEIIEQIRKRHAKERKRRAVPLAQEKPPWPEDEEGDQGPPPEEEEGEDEGEGKPLDQSKQIEKSLLDLVGASPTHGTAEAPPDSFSVGLSSADAVDYILHVEPPIFRSKVQLRGSCFPAWFPGYYVAFPEIAELISLVKNPTIALSTAWKHTQPKVFPDDSFLVI